MSAAARCRLAVLFAGLVLIEASGAYGAASAVPGAKEVFSCTFAANLGSPWRVIGGKWEVHQGCLRQTDPGRDDPNTRIALLG
ncbi:MAG: hypothetical protein NUV77_25495, partial [Thermoguttaceae bacterium]|nr:hypothetical protein [Thermoguttaceae bacterium]